MDVPAVGEPSILLTLASGIYLATALADTGHRGHRRGRGRPAPKSGARRAWQQRRAVAGRTVSANPPSVAVGVLRVRTTLLAAVVIDMVIKPDGAIGLLAAFALMGIAWSIPLWMSK